MRFMASSPSYFALRASSESYGKPRESATIRKAVVIVNQHDGKIVEAWTLIYDQYAWDDYWSFGNVEYANPLPPDGI